jgi:hypothetical protein
MGLKKPETLPEPDFLQQVWPFHGGHDDVSGGPGLGIGGQPRKGRPYWVLKALFFLCLSGDHHAGKV